MFDITITGKLALFVALPTTFVLLYLLLRRTDVRQRILRRWNLTMDRFLSVGQKLKKDDDEEEDDTTTKTRSSRQSVIELKVPSYAILAVIGEDGTTIKKIEKTSRTRIDYKENEARYEEEEKILTIQGERKAVQKAELMIRSIIIDVPNITSEDIYVPNSCTAFLIGKKTKTLKSIKRVSGAEVVFERVNIRDPNYMRLVTLTGTREQNEIAKKIINQKIDEFETFQTTSDSVRLQTSEIPLVDDLLATAESTPEREKWDNEGELELPPLGSQRKDVLELMVVSAENPGHFWGHICNENLQKLFKLHSELEAFYGKSNETEANRISEADKNDIVAVCLDNGTKWFRARITEVLDDGYQVFCVDYGYHEVVSKCDIRKLCGSFLSLPFQALECYLANVKPAENENWSKNATDTFENLVCMNQSKVISGDIIRYQRTSHGLVPCLKLVDYNGPQGTVNINEELVQMGHAEWDEASESEQIFNAEMSQKVLTREGSGSSESLTDPFLKFPPEEKQNFSSPPKDAEWADDFPYAWAYNEEESTARGDVCEMQPCLSDKHSPIGEITQAGAGDIISLQETNTFTKQTSESSYLTTTTGYDEENHALKTDDTKDLSGSLFYNGICSDVDKSLPASPNSPPICHPDGHSVGVPESNLYSFSAEDTHIDSKENILTSADDNSSLSIGLVDSEMTQMSGLDTTVADQLTSRSLSNSDKSLDRSDITRLGSPQDDSGIFCSSIAVSAKADDSTSEFSGMDISRDEDSSAVISLQEDRTVDLSPVTVPGRDESALEILKQSGDSVSISQDTSTLICESEELDENELKGREGLNSNMGTKEDKEEGKDVSGRDPNVFIDINRSGENLEQEQALPCSPQPHLGERDQFSSESSKIAEASEQSTSQLLPEIEATVSGSVQIGSATDLDANQTPFIVQSTRSQSEEHDQCVLGTTDTNTKTCDLKTDVINLSDVTRELITQTVSDTSETLTHDYQYLSETESHKADEISEITDTESCEKLKESGFFSVVPGPCLNDESSSTLDYSQTEPIDVLSPSTTTDISPEPCPTILDPPQTIPPPPPTNILDQAISNVELSSSLESATEVCDVLQEIDVIDSDVTCDLRTRLAEKEVNLIQVEEILSSDSQREISPEVFGQAAVLTVSESKETDSSQCQFVQSLPSINRTLLDKWAMLYSHLEEDDDWEEKTKQTIGQTIQRPKTEQFSRSLETVSEPLENDTHTDDIWKFFYTPISDKERESEDARWVMSEDAEYSEYGYDEHKSWVTDSDQIVLKDQGVFRDDWKHTLSEPLDDDETDFYICSLFEFTISERKLVVSSTDDRQIIYSSEKHIQVVESVKYERDEDVREIEDGVVEEGEKSPTDIRYTTVEDRSLSDSPEYEQIKDIVSTEKITELRETSSLESKSVTISSQREKQNLDLEYSVLEEDEWEEGERTVIKFGEKSQDMKTFQKDWHCTESDPLEEDKEADWLSFYSPVCEDSDMIDTESIPDVGEKQDFTHYSALEEDEWEDGERPKVTYSKEMSSMKTFLENWKETASDPLEEEFEDLPDSAYRTLVKTKTVSVTIQSEKQEFYTEYSTLEDDEWEEGERTGFKPLGERSLIGKTFQENWKDTKSDSLEGEMGDWLSFYSPVSEDLDNVDPESVPDMGEKQGLVKYSGLEDDEWEEGERPKVQYSKEEISIEISKKHWKETVSDPLEEEGDWLSFYSPNVEDSHLVESELVKDSLTTDKVEELPDVKQGEISEDEEIYKDLTSTKVGKKDSVTDTEEEEDWLSYYSAQSTDVEESTDVEDSEMVDAESQIDSTEKSELVSVSVPDKKQNGDLEYSVLEEDEWEEGERTVIKFGEKSQDMKTFQKDWHCTESDPLEEDKEADWLSFYSPVSEDSDMIDTESIPDVGEKQDFTHYSALDEDEWEDGERPKVTYSKEMSSMKTFQDNWKETASDPLEEEFEDLPDSADRTLVKPETVSVTIQSEKQEIDTEYSTLEDDEWQEGERTGFKTPATDFSPGKTFQENWKDTKSDSLEGEMCDWISFYSPVSEYLQVTDFGTISDASAIDWVVEHSNLDDDHDDWMEGERPVRKSDLTECPPMETFQQDWKETFSDPLDQETDEFSIEETLSSRLKEKSPISRADSKDKTLRSSSERDYYPDDKSMDQKEKSPISMEYSKDETLRSSSEREYYSDDKSVDQKEKSPISMEDSKDETLRSSSEREYYSDDKSVDQKEKSPISMEDSKDETLRSSSEREYYSDDKSMDQKEKSPISMEYSKDETLRSFPERDYPDDKSEDKKETDNLGGLASVSRQDGEDSAEELPHAHYQKSSSIEDSMSESDGSFEGQEYEGSDEMLSDSEHLSSEDDETPIVDLNELTVVSNQIEPGYSSSKSDYMSEESEEEDYDEDNFTASDSQSSGEEIFPETGLVECDEEHQVSEESDQEVAAPSSPKSEFSLDEVKPCQKTELPVAESETILSDHSEQLEDEQSPSEYDDEEVQGKEILDTEKISRSSLEIETEEADDEALSEHEDEEEKEVLDTERISHSSLEIKTKEADDDYNLRDDSGKDMEPLKTLDVSKSEIQHETKDEETLDDQVSTISEETGISLGETQVEDAEIISVRSRSQSSSRSWPEGEQSAGVHISQPDTDLPGDFENVSQSEKSADFDQATIDNSLQSKESTESCEEQEEESTIKLNEEFQRDDDSTKVEQESTTTLAEKNFQDGWKETQSDPLEDAEANWLSFYSPGTEDDLDLVESVSETHETQDAWSAYTTQYEEEILGDISDKEDLEFVDAIEEINELWYPALSTFSLDSYDEKYEGSINIKETDEDIEIYLDNEDGSIKSKYQVFDDGKVCRETFLADWKETVSEPLEEEPGYSGIEWRSDVVTDVKEEHYEHPSNYSSLYEDSEWEEKILTSHPPVSKQVEVKMFEKNWKETVSDPLDEDEDSPIDFLQREDGKSIEPEQPEVVLDADEEQMIGSKLQEDNQFSDECQGESSLNKEFNECRVSEEISSESREGVITTDESVDISESLEMSTPDAETKETADSKDVYVAEKRIQVVEDITYVKSVDKVEDIIYTQSVDKELDINLQYSALEEDEWEERDEHTVKVSIYPRMPAETFRENWKETESDPLEEDKEADWLSFYSPVCEDSDMINTESLPDVGEKQDSIKYSALEEDEWEDGERPKVMYSKEMSSMKTFQDNWKETASDPLEEEFEDLPDSVDRTLVKPKPLPLTIQSEKQEIDTEYSTLEDDEWEEGERTGFKPLGERSLIGKTFQENWKDTKSDSLEGEMGDWLSFYSPVSEDPDNVDPESVPDMGEKQGLVKYSGLEDDEWEEGERPKVQYSKEEISIEISQKHWKETVSDPLEEEGDWLSFYSPNVEDSHLVESELVKDSLTTDKVEELPDVKQGEISEDEEIYKDLTSTKDGKKDSVTDTVEEEDWLSYYSAHSTDVEESTDVEDSEMVDAESQIDSTEKSKVIPISVPDKKQNGDLEYSVLEEDEWEEGERTVIKFGEKSQDMKTFQKDWHCTESDPLEEDKEADWLSFYSPVCEDSDMIDTESIPDVGEKQDFTHYSALDEDEWEDGERPKVTYSKEMSSMKTFQDNWKETASDPLEEEFADSADRTLVKPETVSVTIQSEKQEIDTEYSTLEDDEWEEGERTGFKTLGERSLIGKTFQENWKDTKSDSLEGEMGDWLSFYSPVSEDPDNVDPESVPDMGEKQGLVKYSGLEEDEWEEGERPKVQYSKEEISIGTSQKDRKETASELLEPDLCTLSSPESPEFHSETTIDHDENVCDILEEETSSASKAVNTDDKDVWGMYFTSLDEDNDEWNERSEEFSFGISKAVDRSEDFSWEIREQIAQSLPQQSKSASYQSQPKFFSSSLESWVSSGTGTLVTATPGDMSTPAFSDDDDDDDDDTEYIDAQDSFQDEEEVSEDTEPHDGDDFQEGEEKVGEETDRHDATVEQNLSNGSAVRGDTNTNLDPEALSRRQFIEEEISLLLCEIVAMATEETKSAEKRKLSEQDIKEESSKISQQITELIHGMVSSNEGVEKSSEEYKAPQVMNVATQDVDEMAEFTEVVPQEETYSDELVLTPRESELKSCNLHVTQQMEEKLQNIATLYSNYAEEIPDTQLMLKLETLYFIEKLGKDKQKPSPPENLPSLEATSAAGTGIIATGPSIEAVESNESIDSHSRSAVPEIPPDTNEQQLDLGQVETASKSPVSENDEIFANVLMVELPSAEELSVSGEVSSFDASVHECETQRFTSILEVSLPEGPTNENRELTPFKIVPESKKLKLKKKRLSPGDRIARRWRKKSPYRNYSNALFVNIPSFEESSNVEFWKKMSQTCIEQNSDLEDFQKGKKMIQRRISEAGFPIETQSELLLRIPPNESNTWKSKFRCSLHTFVSDYDQKHFHNVFVIPKRHEKYSAEVNMDLNRRMLASGTRKGFSVRSRVSEDSTERSCSPDDTICALSSSRTSENENVTQRKPSIQEKTTIILHDKDENKEKESQRKNPVVIDFATTDDSNNKMSYFTEEQIQDLLRKITQEVSVSHYSKTAIYNDSYFDNNYRYGTNGSHLRLMDYKSSGEIYYDAKTEPDRTMLSTYSEMLLSSNIVSETVAEQTKPDSQVRAGSTDSEGYMTAEEKSESESELQMTQTSERLAMDLSSLLSVDSAELSRELSQSYVCDQPTFNKEQSVSTASSDLDGDYPAGQHLILEFGLEKESKKSEVSDQSSQLEIGGALSELSVTEVEPSLEPDSSIVEPVSAEVKSSVDTLEIMTLEADSSKPKEIPTIHMTTAEDESQEKVCKDHHVKEKTGMQVSLFGEKHMVSSTDELKILVESHDLNIEDFSNIKLSPSSQLDCFSELSFGGASSVDLDELLHQKNLILEVQTTHEDSSTQKEKQKESVSSTVDRTEEFSLIDLPQQIEKSISEYCLQSRKSLTNGTCLPLPEEFHFGIGKPDNEQQVPSEVERPAEPEMVVTESGFDLPGAEDSEDKAEIIKDSTLAAIVDNVLFESEESQKESDSKISPSVKDENESNGTAFAASVKGKKKKKKKSKFFALDNEALMSFRGAAVDVTKTEEEESKSIDKTQMLFEQVDDSSTQSEESDSKLHEIQVTSSKDDQKTNNVYHPDIKELEISEFNAIDIPGNSTLEANRVLIDAKELDKTEADSGTNFLADQIEVSLSDQALLMTSDLGLKYETAEININQGKDLDETEVKPYEDTQVDETELTPSDEPPTLLETSEIEGTEEESAEMSINQGPGVAELTTYEDSQVDQLELDISIEAHPITSELELDQETVEMNINQGSALAETELKSFETSQIDQLELPLSDQPHLTTSDLGLKDETAEINITQGKDLDETEVKPYEDTQVDETELTPSDEPPTLLETSEIEGTEEESAEMSINQGPDVAEVTTYEDSQVDQLELDISIEAHPITSDLELNQETAEININQGTSLAETEFKEFETSQVDHLELSHSNLPDLMTSDLGLKHETAEMNINQGKDLDETEVKPYEDTQVDETELTPSDEPPTLLVASELEVTEENAQMTTNQEPGVAEVTSYEDSLVDHLDLDIPIEAHPITSELELDQETAEININEGPSLAETEFKEFEASQVDHLELPLSDQPHLMTSDLGLKYETAEINITQGKDLDETEVKPYEDTQVDETELTPSDEPPTLLETSEIEGTEEESAEMSINQGPDVAEVTTYEDSQVDQLELDISIEAHPITSDLELNQETAEININQGTSLAETEFKEFETSQVDHLELSLSNLPDLMTSDLGLKHETAEMNIYQGRVWDETEVKPCDDTQVDEIDTPVPEQPPPFVMATEIEGTEEESAEMTMYQGPGVAEVTTYEDSQVDQLELDISIEAHSITSELELGQETAEMNINQGSALAELEVNSHESSLVDQLELPLSEQALLMSSDLGLKHETAEMSIYQGSVFFDIKSRERSQVDPIDVSLLDPALWDQALLTTSELESAQEESIEYNTERNVLCETETQVTNSVISFSNDLPSESDDLSLNHCQESQEIQSTLITESYDLQSDNVVSSESVYAQDDYLAFEQQTVAQLAEPVILSSTAETDTDTSAVEQAQQFKLTSTIHEQQLISQEYSESINISETSSIFQQTFESHAESTADEKVKKKKKKKKSPFLYGNSEESIRSPHFREYLITDSDNESGNKSSAERDIINSESQLQTMPEYSENRPLQAPWFVTEMTDVTSTAKKLIGVTTIDEDASEIDDITPVDKKAIAGIDIDESVTDVTSAVQDTIDVIPIDKDGSKIVDVAPVDKDVTDIAPADKDAFNMSDKEVTKAKSVDKEVTKAKSVDKEVTKAKSIDKEVTKAKSVDKEVTKAKSVDKEVTKAKSVDKEVTKAKSVDKEVTDVTLVDKEVTDVTHVDKEVTKAKSVDKEVTKAKSVDKEVTKAKSVDKEVTDVTSVDKEVADVTSVDKEVADVTSIDKEVTKAKSVDKEVTNITSIEKEVTDVTSVDKEVANVTSIDREVTKAKSVDKEVTKAKSVEKEVTDVTSIDKEVTDVTPVDKSETKISAEKTKKGKKESKESSKKKDSSEKRRRSRSSKSTEKEIYKERSKSPKAGIDKDTILKESTDAPLAEVVKDNEKPSDVGVELFGKDSKKKKKRKKSSLRESPETSKSAGEKSVSDKGRQPTPSRTLPTSEQSVSEEIKKIAPIEKSSEMIRTKMEIAGSKVTRTEEYHSSFLFDTTYSSSSSSVDRQVSSEEELQREFSLEPSDDRTDADESIYSLLPSESEIDVRTDKASIQEELKGEFTTDETPKPKTEDTVLEPSLQEKDKVVKAAEKKRDASVKKSLISKTSSSESNTSVKTSTTVTEKIVSIKSKTDISIESSTKTKHSDTSVSSKSKSRDAKTKSADRKKKTERLEKIVTQPFSAELPVEMPATFAEESKRQNLEQQQEPLDESVKKVTSYQRESSLSENESPKIKVKQKEKKQRRRSPFPYGDGKKSLLSRGIEQFFQSEDEVPKSADAEMGSPCPAKTKTDVIPEPFVSVEPTHLAEMTKLEILPKKDPQPHVGTTKVSKEKSHKKVQEETVSKKPFEEFAGDLPKEDSPSQVVMTKISKEKSHKTDVIPEPFVSVEPTHLAEMTKLEILPKKDPQPHVGTTKVSKEKSHKKVQEEMVSKKPFEEFAGDLPKEDSPSRVVMTKISKEKSHKKVHGDEAAGKPFEIMAGDLPKEARQPQVITTKVTKEKSRKNVHEEEATKMTFESMAGDLPKEARQPQVITTKITKEKSRKNVHEEEATKMTFESMAGDLLKEGGQSQVVTTKVSKDKKHKKGHEEMVSKKPFEDLAGDLSQVVTTKISSKEKSLKTISMEEGLTFESMYGEHQHQGVMTKFSKEKSYKQDPEKEAMMKPVEGLTGDLLKEERQPQVITTTIYSKKISLKAEEEATKKSIECLAGDLSKKEHQPQVIMSTIPPKEKIHKYVRETKEAIFNVPSPGSYVVKDSSIETLPKEVTSKTEKQTKISESRVSQALSKVSSLISKKTTSGSENSSPKHKSLSSSSEENINSSPPLSQASDSSSSLNLGLSRLSLKKKQKKVDSAESVTVSEKTTTKAFTADSQETSESSREDLSTKIQSTPNKEVSPPDSSSETVLDSPVKKEKQEVPKITKSVVEKISSLVTSITKQVTESFEELSTHKKKKLKQSIINEKEAQDRQDENEELGRTIKQKLYSKTKSNKSSSSEDRSKSRTRSKAVFAGSQLLSVQQSSRKTPSPVVSRKKGQKQQQQSSSRRDRQNIPFSTITIESPRREHTYLPLINHLTEEEAAFSDTTPQIKRKKMNKRKERNLSQLSTATESSCEIDTVLWSSSHKRSLQDLSVKKKTRVTQPRITISEDRDYWQSSAVNSPDVIRKEITPIQYLSSDNLSHTRSRSRSHRSPAKELLWLSEQELSLSQSDSHGLNTTRRVRSQSHINRFSKINLAYISTGTRKRKRRKKNIVAV